MPALNPITPQILAQAFIAMEGIQKPPEPVTLANLFPNQKFYGLVGGEYRTLTLAEVQQYLDQNKSTLVGFGRYGCKVICSPANRNFKLVESMATPVIINVDAQLFGKRLETMHAPQADWHRNELIEKFNISNPIVLYPLTQSADSKNPYAEKDFLSTSAIQELQISLAPLLQDERMGVGATTEEGIGHSAKTFIFDASGNLRAYADSTNMAALQKALKPDSASPSKISPTR